MKDIFFTNGMGVIMKKMRYLTGIVLASLAVVLVGQQGMASDESALYTGRPLDFGYGQSNLGGGYFCNRPSQWYFGAWAEAGVYTNSNGTGLDRSSTWGNHYLPSERFGFTSGNGIMLGNLQNPRFNMNQMGLFLERKMNTCRGFDWGFKTEMMFGTDAYLTQSHEDFWMDHDWRSGDYYTSISDLYLTAGYRNLGVKVGKFASPLSYEHAESPNNFFYSHSYGFLQSPDTHSGVVVDYQISCPLSVFAGWTTGSDAGWANRFGDSAVLAGLKAKLWDGGTLTYAMQYANLHGGEYDGEVRASKMLGFYLFPDNGSGIGAAKMDAYYHSMVFTQKLGKWNYAAEWYYMKTGNYSGFWQPPGAISPLFQPYSRFGIAQYLTYQINCKLGVGMRAEWMHCGALTGISLANYDAYALTFGANWSPVSCLMIRPELRYDWCQSGQLDTFFNNRNNREQLSGGVSVMYKF